MQVDSSLWTGIGFNGFPHMSKHPEYHKAEAEHERDYRLSVKKYRLVRASTILLVLTLAIAGIAARFAWQQVEVARDTARKQLRAYLFVELAESISREFEQFNRARLRFNNSGPTPAYRLACDVKIFPERPKVGESWEWTFPRRDDLTCRVGVLAETASRFFKAKDPITIDDLIEGEHHLFVVGVIYYDDIYREPHWVTFCMQWSRDNLTPDGTTYCNVYNETDETLPELPKRGPLVILPFE